MKKDFSEIIPHTELFKPGEIFATKHTGVLTFVRYDGELGEFMFVENTVCSLESLIPKIRKINNDLGCRLSRADSVEVRLDLLDANPKKIDFFARDPNSRVRMRVVANLSQEKLVDFIDDPSASVRMVALNNMSPKQRHLFLDEQDSFVLSRLIELVPPSFLKVLRTKITSSGSIAHKNYLLSKITQKMTQAKNEKTRNAKKTKIVSS